VKPITKEQALARHYARRIMRDQRGFGIASESELANIQRTCAAALEGAFIALDWEYECRTLGALENETETWLEVHMR
jgi:hypothetical protein